MSESETVYRPDVWVEAIAVECPFCEERIPIQDEGSPLHPAFVVHNPCGRMYEIPNVFKEPLDEGCGEGWEPARGSGGGLSG